LRYRLQLLFLCIVGKGDRNCYIQGCIMFVQIGCTIVPVLGSCQTVVFWDLLVVEPEQCLWICRHYIGGFVSIYYSYSIGCIELSCVELGEGTRLGTGRSWKILEILAWEEVLLLLVKEFVQGLLFFEPGGLPAVRRPDSPELVVVEAG
jgi:hypothetical protein